MFLLSFLVRLTAASDPPGAAEVVEWLGIPAWIIGIGTVLLLWLRGVIMLRSDHDRALAALTRSHESEVAAVRSAAETRIREIERRADALQDRNEHLVSDRDAWRDAHHEETRARQAAERAGAALMETGQISLALLGALKDSLAGRPETGRTA